MEYKKGYSYLVRTLGGTVWKIKIVEITETSFNIQYESGNKSWMTKKDFDFEYTFIEELKKTVSSIFYNS